MKKYEYKVVVKRVFIEKMLNKLGKEGWELITTISESLSGTSGADKYIFRRELKEK